MRGHRSMYAFYTLVRHKSMKRRNIRKTYHPLRIGGHRRQCIHIFHYMHNTVAAARTWWIARTSGSAKAARRSDNRSAALPLKVPCSPRACGITTGTQPCSRSTATAFFNLRELYAPRRAYRYLVTGAQRSRPARKPRYLSSYIRSFKKIIEKCHIATAVDTVTFSECFVPI